ncbi:hypothetical protein JCM8097_008087 [Rhodosporidiobolus ruineniae]
MDLIHRIVHGPPDRKRTPIDNKRRLHLFLTYAPDWIVTIVLLAVIAYLTNKAGYKREFSLTDTSLQHTYATKERITFGECIVYAGVVPAVCIILVAAIWRRSFWDAHNGVLGLLLSVALTTVFTQVVKICVGRPRPDIIDRCQPLSGAANKAVYGLAVAAEICTTDINSHVMLDGFRSFPSGHSSFAWSGLGFFALYLCGKMHLFDRRGHTFKAWIAIVPPIGATLIAVSRTMDYRHHATDVIAGSILGAVIALLTYHLYYPSLFSHQCHLPYSPRIPPSLPHDRLSDASDPSTAPRPAESGIHPGGGGGGGRRPAELLPTHRFSSSISSSTDEHDLSADGMSPNDPAGNIPLESSFGRGETARRPKGGVPPAASAAGGGEYYELPGGAVGGGGRY